MSDWKTMAAGLTINPTLHPWSRVLRNTLEQTRPEDFATLTASGDLDDYIRVHVGDALQESADLQSQGMPKAEADELALGNLFPAAAEPLQEYEREGGDEDHIEALDKFLATLPAPAKAAKMSLSQPGAVQVVNGVTYELNRAHQWKRVASPQPRVANMGNWQKLSLAVPAGAEDHPWAMLLRHAMKTASPTTFMSLERNTLEAYIRVQVGRAMERLETMTRGGASYDTARDAVLADLQPSEGLRHVKRMALQPGTTKSINGVSYTLNQSHRWERTRRDKASPRQPGQAKPGSKGGGRGMTIDRARQGLKAKGYELVGGVQPTVEDMKAKVSKYKVADKAGNIKVMTSKEIMGLLDGKPAANPKQPAGAGDAGPAKPRHNPQVDSDPNHDGITDNARVGVGAFEVPPPPKKIKRIPGLTGVAKKAEEHFATSFEMDADRMTEDAGILFTGSASGGPPTFETDACKKLSPFWASTDLDKNLEQRSKNRATLNTALHQTANAICKRAFLKHLDTLPEGSEILVTVGGCGAGKGFALKKVPQALAMKERAAVVWDSAGDQNATENPWILQEARHRKLKVSFVYVHADPKVSWADPERGVVQRARNPEDGRMVDAMVFADSYAIGAQNFAAFHDKHKDDPDANFVILRNKGATPELLGAMPPEALSIDRHELTKFAIDTINSRPDLPEHVRSGALGGTKLWED